MEFSDHARFVATREVAQTEIDGEAVVLNLRDGNYYGLNAVASQVWQWLREPRTMDELEGLLMAEFKVDAGRAGGDLRKLLADLRTRKLIDVVE
jgi:hypothetical protein